MGGQLRRAHYPVDRERVQHLSLTPILQVIPQNCSMPRGLTVFASAFSWRPSLCHSLAPRLITSGFVHTFLATWNSLMWGILVTNKPEMRPIQVGMAAFIGEAGTQIQLLLAAVTISVIPVIHRVFDSQRWFIEGIATVGIRG